MKSANFKHVYALVLLGLTFLWAVFCVWVTWQAVRLATGTAIIVAAGVDTLLGALISWNALVIQHYFRKSTPEDAPAAPQTPPVSPPPGGV